jgi:hypothetical protein
VISGGELSGELSGWSFMEALLCRTMWLAKMAGARELITQEREILRLLSDMTVVTNGEKVDA